MINLHQLLELANCNHTDIQMDRFITIRSGGTAYGCLFQALRELSTRYQALQGDQCLIAKALIKLKSSKYKLEHSTISQEERQVGCIRVVELEMRVANLQLRLKATQREFIRFYSQSSSLYKLLGFDKDHPTAERLNQLEEERWEYRILADAALSLIQTGTISSSIVSMIQCLPIQLRNKLLERCFGTSSDERQQRMQELTQWYMSYEFVMPDVAELSEQEKQEVLGCCELSNLPKLLGNSSQTGAGLSHESSIKRGLESVKVASRD